LQSDNMSETNTSRLTLTVLE